MKRDLNAEKKRLREADANTQPWRKWGPYLSERQWGTVREDYSDNGDAWSYLSHDHARSRAYHWGEDGLAGICDDKQHLCFALALWNERDPILKERFFGLTNGQGNHGEDVKEYYFYLDSTPTHSYLSWLYKYPQREYPYQKLIDVNGGRSRSEFEYELLDTGIFDANEYFDVFVEYAKAGPEDILVNIRVVNCGDSPAAIHLLPTLWFRNSWKWWPDVSRPELRRAEGADGVTTIFASHSELGKRWLYIEGDVPCLFTENETNSERLDGQPNATPYVKDAFHESIVHGRKDCVNPEQVGTKAAAHRRFEIGAHGSVQLRLRLSDRAPEQLAAPFQDFDALVTERKAQADEFYAEIAPRGASEDQARVFRQALAGMLWSKQFYFYDLGKWLAEHGIDALAPERQIRNAAWGHMYHADVISMPDKWEYPWYAAWDLAFHALALSAVDPKFAKGQLDLITRERYIHPSSQTPAYEWNFGDVNPPVHAWATIFLHRIGAVLHGENDVAFLKRSFVQLDSNFAWWTNRKDRAGRNLFEGGFLGLDNIGVFDRSAPLPTGGYLEQADGTAWMALFAQNMLEIAVEVATEDPVFDEIATKYAEHFLQIANAINRVGATGMWDEEDGFYYDVLKLPDGNGSRLKVRSLVGLLPLCATTVIEPWQRDAVPEVMRYVQERVKRTPALLDGIHPTGAGQLGKQGRGILAVVNEERLRRILKRLLSEDEFLGAHGIRSVSRFHLEHPYTYWVQGNGYTVNYLPAESNTGMFGGNSNWRGPVWFPLNILIIRALTQFYAYYGDDFKVECPVGSGRQMTLFEVARELGNRLSSIFLRGADGRRPVYGGLEKFQTDPRWRDLISFHEYFHGDNGAGLGASHQTGWTGTVALLMRYFSAVQGADLLQERLPRTATRNRSYARASRSPRARPRGMSVPLETPADRRSSFQHGFPTTEVARDIHAEEDLQRAVEAYRFFYPSVSMECLFQGIRELGIADSSALAYLTPRPHHRVFTACSDTPYSCAVLDLFASGPVVIEMPAGPYSGLLNDHHQRWIQDLGVPGRDGGRGGRYLVLPPGFGGVVPTGYIAAQAETYKVLFAVRALPLEGGNSAALQALQRIKVHPLSDSNAVFAHIDITDRPLDTTPLRWENGLEYWYRLHALIDGEPILDEYRPMYGALAALGLQRGQRFLPELRIQDVFQRASSIGLEQMRVEAFASDRPDRMVWADRRWEWVCLLADQPNFEASNYLDLQARDRWFFQALTLSPAMVRRESGMGSVDFLTARDADGVYLDGGNSYVLRVPDPVPARLFWSVTAYDANTRSQIQTATNNAAISSLTQPLAADDGGSIEICFGPSLGNGKPEHWIETTAETGFFVYFRIYGPESESLDGTWRLGDLSRRSVP